MAVGRLSRIRRNLRRAYESSTQEPPEPVVVEPPVEEPSPESHSSTMSRDDAEVPHVLRLAAAWSWRLIVVGVIGYVLLRFFGTIRIVVIPLSIALLLSALLTPAVGWLLRFRFPRSLATGLVLVAGLGAVVGTLTMVVTQFVDGLPELSQNATVGIRQIQTWLREGPLHLDDEQFNTALITGQQWLDQNTQALTTGAVSTAATVFELFTGALLVLFSTFFFLRDGRNIWRFTVRLFPVNARWRMADAGEASWQTLVAYVRATVLVAFIDAVGIGLFLVIFHVPFPFPLAALVFLGAFIPIVGATVSGAVAILVALVDSGWVTALIILGVVIAVQQVEGHILQPLIMGRAVAIHPLAVIIGIAGGVVLAGITGALVAVPLIAVLNTAVRRLTADHHRPEPPPEAVVVRSETP
ncbi:AI-2E family transporter [Catenuloplanes sp. NPDC051500]|uniref:AI-2E family transporter n=1 Tax=Catenuloplanes sp. NPDC051500 TaxID=3363959 RepID=UPI0037A2877D